MDRATNRQKKCLSFFGVEYSPKISRGAAGWELGDIFSDEENRDRWRRYIFLTKDFSFDNSDVMEYDEDALDAVVIPEDWSIREELEKGKDEFVSQILENDGSPFDKPQPEIEFEGKGFMFTGKFEFGTRDECREEVEEYGGFMSKTSMGETDYLVIGSEGSQTWSRGNYGNKIKKAILSRRRNGRPAIISEAHWLEQMDR